MREFERAIERGEDVASANLVLEQLRKIVRGRGRRRGAAAERRSGAAVVSSLEPFLVEGNFPVRPGQIRRASLLPVWQWLSRDGAPEAAAAFEAALAEIRQSGSTAGLEAATRKFQLAAAEAIVKIATPAAGRRQAARAGPYRPAQCRRGSAVDRRGAARARGAGYAGQPASQADAGACAIRRSPR